MGRAAPCLRAKEVQRVLWVQEVQKGVVRRIKNQKRRGAFEYAVFTKGGRPVNLWNLPSDDSSHCMKMQEQNQTTI